MPQTFEDLVVEKEVAVRKQIAKECAYLFDILGSFPLTVYSGTPASISSEMTSLTQSPTMTTSKKSRISVRPSLSSYSTSLLTPKLVIPAFNLINDIDVEKTRQRIATYRSENAALIEANIARESAYAKALHEADEASKRERQLRADELRAAEEAERAATEAEKNALIDSLEQSDVDAHSLVAKSRAEAVKRARERTREANRAMQISKSASVLLRTRAAQSEKVPDVPHVPLQDDWDAYEDKYTVMSTYYDPVSELVRKDREGIMRAGGYRVEEAWERALRSAVAGLDVIPLGSATNGEEKVQIQGEGVAMATA